MASPNAPTLASLSIATGTLNISLMRSTSGKFFHPPTWVDRATVCLRKSTGPPKPMPQRSNSQPRARLSIRASIHSGPPSRSVESDARCTIRSPLNKARENLVPPISMARVFIKNRTERAVHNSRIRNLESGWAWDRAVCLCGSSGRQHFLRRCRAGAFFHDGDGGHQVAEARCPDSRTGDGQRHRRGRGKTVARAADVDRVFHLAPFGDGLPLLVDHQRAVAAPGNEQQPGIRMRPQRGEVDASQSPHGRLLCFVAIRLQDDAAKKLGADARVDPD